MVGAPRSPEGAAVSERRERFDVLVVGAGPIGLACAWRALERGLSVCVLERGAVGSGASDVAAGMLAPVGEASWGEESLLELNLASHALWPAFAEELRDASGMDPGFARSGALHVALGRDESEALRRQHELHREHDLESEWLTASECRQLEPGLAPRLAGGVFAPHEGAADPRALVASLAAAVRGGGGSSERGGERVCSRIVVGDRLYMVPRPDGRLLVGATVEEKGFDTTVTAGGVHELLRESYRTLPETAEMELVEIRAGLRPGTPDNGPILGWGPGAVVFATGHFRNGILLAPATADAVAALLSGEAPPIDLRPFSPGRFAGTPAVAAAPGPGGSA